MLLASLVAAYFISESDFRYFWRTPKLFGLADLKIGLYTVGAFLSGAMGITLLLPPVRRTPDRVLNTAGIPWSVVRIGFWAGFLLTIFGYVCWLLYSIKNGLRPGDLIAFIKGEPGAAYTILDKTDTIAGVTTLTQIGMGAGIVGVLLGCRFGWRRVAIPLMILFGLAFAHGYFRSERLAIIELGLPMAITFLLISQQAERGIIRRWLLMTLPVGAVFLLYALFSFSEFFRSWSDFYSQRQNSFLWFSLIRLVGYYATAMNNGAALMQDLHSNSIPYLTIEWFWKFPVLKDFLAYSKLTGVDPQAHYFALLKSDVNPEFNNPSGIFPVVVDYGLIGALLFWFCAGIIAILLYRLFLSARLTGLLIYPFFYVGLLESPRVFYWGSGRSFPTWIFLLGIIALIFILSQIKARNAPPSRPNRGRLKLAISRSFLLLVMVVMPLCCFRTQAADNDKLLPIFEDHMAALRNGGITLLGNARGSDASVPCSPAHCGAVNSPIRRMPRHFK
jgi:oligosaccharide repeat unit polymerase